MTTLTLRDLEMDIEVQMQAALNHFAERRNMYAADLARDHAAKALNEDLSRIYELIGARLNVAEIPEKRT